MGIAIKGTLEQIKPNAAEIGDEEDDYAPDVPFDYEYDADGYLVSDGQPMAEHEIHRKQMNNSIESLEAHFSGRVVYVSGNNYLHYKMDDRTAYISPDGYVVFDVPQDIRESYKVWEHGNKMPAIVFEFTSKKTRKEDEGKKFTIYEQILKTPEYILFDPRADYLKPRLRGYRLNASGEYELIALDSNGRMYSEQLNLYLEPQGRNLRFFDAEAGEYLRTPAEEARERLLEKDRANREARRAAREARARREEAQRANSEAQRANEEATARQGAERRAEEAEAEIARLRAELEKSRRNPSS